MIQVVDLGINNLVSLVRSLEEVSGLDVRVLTSPKDLRSGNLLVLPGTGAFGTAMDRLRERDFPAVLRDWVADGTGILAGVCLGMQLLADSSEEAPEVPGLSLLGGEVAHLSHLENRVGRVPHVGWAGVSRGTSSSFLWASMKNGSDFYFSHSFHLVVPRAPELEILETSFGEGHFVSAVRKNNIVGFQFHPEKSSREGLAMLRCLVDESRNIG